MGLKSILAKPFARIVYDGIRKHSMQAVKDQNKIFQMLVNKAAHTRFGNDHRFNTIHSYEDFKRQIPIRDYEGLKTYIESAIEGEENVIWPGRPLYWSKTSGTTSGVKFIPITKDSIPYHIRSARNALLCYIAETGNADFVDGKLIFLSGSPELDYKYGVPVGRLSGIVNHHVPKYLRSNQMPSYETNCMEDWEEKVNRIVEETLDQNMTLISGIPPWVQMYFDQLLSKSGKKNISELFPHFSLFVYGGVNYEPYRTQIEETMGKKIDTVETYPASEGFIAYQDSRSEEGLLLLTDNGIFYEFIPVDHYSDENPPRLSLKDVQLGQQYALILNTNAGLFGYSIGDTIRFVSKDPYRILVTGRIKHFISAFGEHVIAEEVEYALMSVAKRYGAGITEFTVAPQVSPPEGGLPYHEWFVEFGDLPSDIDTFAGEVDALLQQKNIYYQDLLKGHILQPLKLRVLKNNAFIDFMKEQGKLGGQNKVPRLSNDRKMADELKRFVR